MGLFPQQFIDDLRLQANIVQVVQEYVPLKRAGTTYKGLCPFHAEKTPSFHVNPDKGFFHCFGCNTGGDVFKFLELHEKIGFQDAVRLLAQKFGMALPEMSDASSDDARLDSALREAILKVHEVAAAYFREQLASPPGARARQQLSERGISQATIDQLGLGFAVSAREGLRSRLLQQGFAEPLLLQSGLLVRRESGEVVDRFRNRLMIPISRDTGSVIAFGGRSMDADQVPKYLNSPETPIYSKGRTLYGLNLTKAQIRKVGFAVLVEGYFDVAQLFQSQAAPAVASCGTALTSQQAQLLRRFTSKVVLSFDPDAAGQGAAARSCELLVAEGFDVNVVVLDRGLDPDTFIRTHGADQYRARLRGSRPYLEYLLDQAASGLDLGHDDNRRDFLIKMLGVAARIPDMAARDQFADRIAHKARITEEVVRAEIRKAAVSRKTTLTSRELPAFGELKHAEKGLIWGLIHDTGEARAALAALEDDDLDSLSGRDIFRVARSLHAEPPDRLPSALIQRLSTVNAQLVTSIAAGRTSPAPSADCARALRRLRWERERADIQREIDRLQQLGATENGHEIDTLWQRKIDLLHRIEELT
ncbi:MAG: DNA primase [Acidobacteria bacterium RIFCSPLOWO2_12_FULL_65_11]|nr:MAG: DNA primase [Acidobacteria bacterium RIFCSPLOWO2_02_FULL_64_15]OFW32200.1 MAG: DNA primase [Acidobacteria bacterium RIFCSPLOWO2_12_FULL_65_11]